MPSKLFQLCLAFWLVCALPARAGEGVHAGFLYEEFKLTLAPGTRTEILGPLFSFQQSESASESRWTPALSITKDPDVEMTEIDFLYPLLTYDRFGGEYRWQFFQLLSWSGGQTQEEIAKKRFTLFPLYFQQRSANPELNYTAVGPFYGTLKNRLFRDEIRYIMFPLYGQSRKRDVVTDNFVYPFFHLRHGDELRGWQFWPVVGHEHKNPTTRTNTYEDVVTIGGHDKFWALWPIFAWNRLNTGTENPTWQHMVLPLYNLERSPQRDASTFLWPFIYVADNREKKFREWGMPWPFVDFARGEGKRTDRVWPLGGRTKTPATQSDFFLWPIYKHNTIQAAPLDRERTRIVYFLYDDLRETSTETGVERRRRFLWPLFIWRKDLDENQRLQFFAPLEPLLPENKSISRNYSPIWSLWTSERNPKAGTSSQSVLWNLYRREKAPGVTKGSLFFGLVQYQSSSEGRHWRWFHWPSSRKAAAPENAGPESADSKHK